jgi:hypothetical protein
MIDNIQSQFSQCRDVLLAQREPLVLAIKDARLAEAQATELLKQLDDAIVALNGSRPRSLSKQKRPPVPHEKRECSNKDEVMLLLQEVLEFNPTFSDLELKDAVAEKLRQRGRSLSMFANLFIHCVREPSVAGRRQLTNGVRSRADVPNSQLGKILES